MMSLFKKEAPPPPGGEVRAKSTYDLDIEADGDDPATAASVVAALYAKYKKNVRHTHPPGPAPTPRAADRPTTVVAFNLVEAGVFASSGFSRRRAALSPSRPSRANPPTAARTDHL
jgi:hypothetical protein